MLVHIDRVHKRRNVLDHLKDQQKPMVAKKLNAAYALEDYAAAKQALTQLHRELMDLNPSAARSLGEALEETLTVQRLRIPPQLRKTLACTNVIESAFSIVERVCRNVKRWHDGDQRERWVDPGCAAIRALLNTPPEKMSDIPRKRYAKAKRTEGSPRCSSLDLITPAGRAMLVYKPYSLIMLGDLLPCPVCCK